MISVDEQLVTMLNANAGVTALRAGRMYPTKLPQDVTLPAQTYRRVSALREQTHSGPTDFVQSRYQVNSFAATITQARALAKATRLAIGRVQDTGMPLRASFKCLSDMDMDEPDSDTPFVAQDYLIEHREDI